MSQEENKNSAKNFILQPSNKLDMTVSDRFELNRLDEIQTMGQSFLENHNNNINVRNPHSSSIVNNNINHNNERVSNLYVLTFFYLNLV
jgi:hypothetical protein